MEYNRVSWNPWHGCTKVSQGCRNCYVDRLDKRFGRNPGEFSVNGSLHLPIKRDRKGNYKVPSGSEFMTCFTSDFLYELADEVRTEAWNCIRERSDCTFTFVTKRIDRFMQCIPEDWNDGWNNVCIYVTAENQGTAGYRLPILLDLPIKHRGICIEPMLEGMDISTFLESGRFDLGVIAGGESGSSRVTRALDYKWIEDIKNQCSRYNTPFWFKQTGTRFIDHSGVERTVIHHGDQYKLADMYNISSFSLI